MAVVVNTSFTDTSTLLTAFTNAPDLFDLEDSPWNNAFDEFQDNEFIDGAIQTPTHLNGSVVGGGTFDIFGSGLTGTSPVINQIIYLDNSPAGTLEVNSTGGIRPTATSISGSITSINYELTDGSYLFEFVGSASMAENATTLTATRVRVVSGVLDAEITGSITVNNETGDVVSGTVTGFTLITGGEEIEVSGVSIAALTFMQEFLDQPAFEVMLGTLFGGANTFNATAAGAQTLTGFGGDDVYNIDYDDVIVENAAQGTDTARVMLTDGQSHTLANNVEKLTLFDQEGTITGIGNTLANVITGAVGAGSHNSLAGGDANDTLIGGAGSDTLEGGAGTDSVNGGQGDDRFIVQLATAAATSVLSDTLSDPGGTDTLVVLGGEGKFSYTMTFIDTLDASGAGVNDSITGSAFDNSILGGGGDDTLLGMGGADTINGLGGNNSLDGGLGDDTYVDEFGNDTFVISQAGDTIIAGGEAGGTDTVRVALAASGYLDITGGNAFLENVTFTGAGNVAITGNVSANVLTGKLGNDSLSGDAGIDILNGDAGNDSLDGGAGADSMAGGAGNDTFAADDAGDAISDTGGIDTVVATGISYTLGVTSGIEKLIMSGGATTGTGNALNNTLTSEEGAHTLDGAGGNDTYNVQAEDAVLDTGVSLMDTVIATLNNGDVFTAGEGIDRLTLIGSEAGITITGNGNELNNILTGANNANDSLVGGDGNDSLAGNGGNDTLVGGAGRDTLNGGLGNDSYNVALTDVAAAALSDTVTDSGGTDSLVVFDGTGVASFTYTLAAAIEHVDVSNLTNAVLVKLTGNALGNNMMGHGGVDFLSGLGGDDTLGTGGGGGDTLLGGDGNDSLDGSVGIIGSSMDGGAGNDYLFSFANGGLDTLAGGLGNDTFRIDNGDLVSDTGGTDTIEFTGPTLSLAGFATIENLTLLGGGEGARTGTGNALANVIISEDGPDTLDGGAGNDTLDSSTQADSLVGGEGNDSLIGGGGADSMVGGTGDDTFSVDDAGDTVSEGEGGGTDLVISTVSFDMSLLSDLENLTLLNGGTTGTGNAAANVLTAGEGFTTLIGGAGNDTFNVRASDTVSENFDEGTDLVNASLFGGEVFTLGANVDNLTLLFLGEGTTITGTGNALANTILGTATSDDSLSGLNGNDSLVGNAGNDSLDGGTETDTVVGGDGNDSLDGGGFDGSVDSLVGGLGNDTFSLFLANEGGGLDPTFDAVSETMAGVAGGADLLAFASEGVTSGTFNIALTANLANFEHLDFSGLDAPANVSGTGNAANNSMIGHGGNDTLSGLGGNDTIDGLVGSADFIAGGDGNDHVVLYGEGAPTADVNGGAGSDTLVFAGGGAITLADHVTFEHLTLRGGGAGPGTGNAAANIMTSDNGAHALDGAGGNDTYNVQADDAVLDTGVSLMDTAIATLDGGQAFTLGEGIERLTLIGSEAGITITGNGNELANLINGANNANDVLVGNELNDTMNGNGGDDTLDGGTGNDSLSGGGGNDDYFVDSALDKLGVEAVAGGIDAVHSGVNWKLLANYEKLFLTGGENVTGTGNTGNNEISGNTGNNILSGDAGNDTLDGGDGNDSLVGGAGNDSLVGGVNSDTLDGGLGNDTYATGDGDDTYVITEVGDTLNVVEGVDQGIDTVKVASATSTFRDISGAGYLENILYTGTVGTTLTGNAGANMLTGGTGADTLLGSAGADTLNGGGGKDNLNGGLDADLMVGGAGDDTYRVDNLGDGVTELAAGGADEVISEIFHYELTANVEKLTLTSQEGLEAGAVEAVGNTLANSIVGNSAANILAGGLGGNDTFTGGGGADSFVFDRLGANVARITDFDAAGDLLAFSDDVAEYSALFDGEGLLGGALSTTGAAVGAGVAQFVYNAGTGALFYDSNGSTTGFSTQIGTLVNKPAAASITADDFSLFTGFIA